MVDNDLAKLVDLLVTIMANPNFICYFGFLMHISYHVALDQRIKHAEMVKRSSWHSTEH